MRIVPAILLIFVLLTVLLTGCGASEDTENQIDGGDVVTAEDPTNTTEEFIAEDDYVEIGEMI